MNKTLHKTGPAEGILPKDWQEAQENFTADEVFQAYMDGKKAGREEEVEKLKKDFSLNVKAASSIAEELLEIAADKHVPISIIHLKARSINSFEALFLVDEEAFLSPKINEVYTLGRKFREKYTSDKFHLFFSFTSKSEEINLDCLAADGYFMRYEKKKAS
jgi:hypothetical protein